jgi:hypothetical protein
MMIYPSSAEDAPKGPDDEEEDTMDHDVSPPRSAIDDNALILAKTLRDAYEAWIYRDGREDEVWILTEVLLKGIFGFAARTTVCTLDLDERGAETITRDFAQALADTIQRRRHARQRRNPHDDMEEDA